MSNYNVIRHYVSEYYDPVKAHEYYEAHKKLKGRHSTAGLNDEGKAAAEYVKKNLDEERNAKIEESKNQMDSKTESRRSEYSNEVKKYSEQTTAQIKRLRDYIGKMSKTQKAARRKNIENQIARLREENNKKRAAAQEKYKSDIQSYKGEHNLNSANIRLDYDDKYANELERIASDPAMQAPKTSKKSTNSKNSTTSTGTRNPGYSDSQIRAKLIKRKK